MMDAGTPFTIDPQEDGEKKEATPANVASFFGLLANGTPSYSLPLIIAQIILIANR